MKSLEIPEFLFLIFAELPVEEWIPEDHENPEIKARVKHSRILNSTIWMELRICTAPDSTLSTLSFFRNEQDSKDFTKSFFEFGAYPAEDTQKQEADSDGFIKEIEIKLYGSNALTSPELMIIAQVFKLLRENDIF